MNGPIETERQAIDSARHIYDSPPGTGAWGDGCRRLLEDACTAAGLRLGAYDHRILLWLAGFEPSACAVVAGLIRRAHAAGPGTVALDAAQLDTALGALDDAADYRWAAAQASCEHCNRLDPARCADHARDEELSARYTALATQLRQEAGR